MLKHNPYIGHSSQLSGVQEVRLVGGKGDGMRLLQVSNGLGIMMTVSLDRCADISTLSLKGVNYGYFAESGYVAPAYYNGSVTSFLEGFSAGFLTTCGLSNVGVESVVDGVELPLHGTISNTPAEHYYWVETDEAITIHARVNQAKIFSDKLILHRQIVCSKSENLITIEDTIENTGLDKTPCMILYHMNVGYPLLSEQSVLNIPSSAVKARTENAAEAIDTWSQVIEPTKGFVEQCYYHSFEKDGGASIYNPEIKKGLKISYDAKALDYFVQWKMMGVKEYVLGLEPDNCHPDGRDQMAKEDRLKYIDGLNHITYKIKLELTEVEEC